MSQHTITGRCLCGDVTYSADAEPIFAGVCHCKNCQRQAGSAFSVLIGLPRSSVTRSGTLKRYQDTADSGNAVNRLFCPNCGSPVFTEVPTQPDVTYIKAGTLDDTSILKPSIHFWTGSKQEWVDVPDDVPSMAGNP